MLIKILKQPVVMLVMVCGGVGAVIVGLALATMLSSNGEEGSALAGDVAFLMVLPVGVGIIVGMLALIKFLLKKKYNPVILTKVTKTTVSIYVVIAVVSTVIFKLNSS